MWVLCVCVGIGFRGSQLHAHGVDESPHEPAYGVVLWWRNLHGCYEAVR
jgi:hypothetical protein